MRLAHHIALRTEATGDDDPAVLGERLADRVERLLDGAVDEPAGIDDDELRLVIARDGRVTFGAKLRQDALGIDERLGTAERNESDLRSARGCDFRSLGGRG
jgi:hypothetical protein